MSASPQSPRVLELPYRWADRDGSVRVEIRENDDPAALGCPEFARGYPYCCATMEPLMVGYSHVVGWVQLVASNRHKPGFAIDPFLPIGPVPHPFAFCSWSTALFDAPHSDFENWDFLAHTFLCGLGGKLHDLRHEARAILGFSWGFSKQGQEFEFLGPDPLQAADWDGHREYLARSFPEWTFAPGFLEHPLRP